MQTGVGHCFKDDQGCILLMGTRQVHANWAVDVSEASAACYGLEVAKHIGFNFIHLEGDALTVMSTIPNKDNGLTPIHLVYDCSFDYLSSLDGFQCALFVDVVIR